MQPSEALAVDRYDFTRAFLNGLPDRRTIFDIGAGQCPMREPAVSAGHDWHGFDLAPSEPAVTSWNLNHPCPADEKADAVIMLDVIEHLFNVDLALSNIVATMKPGAVLLLTMPNPCWSRSRVHHLAYGNLAAFTQDDLDHNHHVFPVWPHVLQRLLSIHNLTITDYVTLDGRTGWPKPRSWLWPLLVVEAGLRKVIEKRDPRATGFSYAVVARLGDQAAAT